MSTSSNKRKAADLTGSGEGSGRPPPALRKEATASAAPDELHLPAPVWGHVMDYMPYDEVRSALLICKMIANEAVKYVQTLNIMMSCQLVGPPARRFPNVEEVNCLCLVRGSDKDNLTLCGDTSIRLVPFLTGILRLKRIFAGGSLRSRWGFKMKAYDCKNPHNHKEIFQALVYSFLGALKSKMLPSTLEGLEGITDPIDTVELCRGLAEVSEEEREEVRLATHCNHWDPSHICAECSPGPCSFCREICAYFPVKDLYKVADIGLCDCVGRIGIYETISKREGAKEIFRNDSTMQLMSGFLVECGERVDCLKLMEKESDPEKRKQVDALMRRLVQAGADTKGGINEKGVISFLYVPTSEDVALSGTRYFTLPELDRMISAGFDPKAIPRKDFLSRIVRGWPVVEKKTFDALISRGFPLNLDDVVILETAEMALLFPYINI